jgi:hypothetical protein
MTRAISAITILDAMRDNSLFARWFRNPATWAAWFAFLAAMFGLPLTPEQLATFQNCTGRSAPLPGGFSESWLICGRRSGKSFILALIAVFLACFRDWSDRLIPGETGTIMVVAADRKQSRVIFRYITALITKTPLIAGLVDGEVTQGRINLVNGVSIEIVTSNFRVTRGYTVIAALCDEIAFWMGEDSANPDREVIAAIKPAIATLAPDAMLLCASSPHAQRGALYDAFRKYYGHDEAAVLVWQADTVTMNPTVPKSVIEDAYEADPASAASEFGAAFRNDLASYISREVVEGAVDRGVSVRPFEAGVRYTSWIDASSGASDSFALAIAHAVGRDLLLVDNLTEVRAPFNTAAATQQIADVLKSYGLRETMGDDYAKGWVVSELARHGVGFTPRPPQVNRSALYLETLSLFSAGRVRLLDNKRLVAQYSQLERRVQPAGRDVVNHPARSAHHDDLSNVCAGVLWRLQSGVGAPLVFTAEMIAQVQAFPAHRPGVYVWPVVQPRPRVFFPPTAQRGYPASVLPSEKFDTTRSASNAPTST